MHVRPTRDLRVRSARFHRAVRRHELGCVARTLGVEENAEADVRQQSEMSVQDLSRICRICCTHDFKTAARIGDGNIGFDLVGRERVFEG
jgi:hypothetical protein